MFNNSSHIDASRSTFSEVHRDQYYNAHSMVQGPQMINTIVHGNQILQDSHSILVEGLQKASAPSAAHDSAQRYPAPKCIEGTRTELLTRITSWIDKPDGKPISWLNGRPGSGKSAVAQTVAEKYASERRLAASFFFSRRDLERRTTQHVVPTLTTQLLAFLPSIRPAIIKALEDDYMIPMKVLREQMEKLLLEPLSTATETPDKPLLIVLDALDECDDEGLVSELVTLVAFLPRRTTLPLRLLITSRSEPWLRAQFHRPDISTLTLSLEIHAFSAKDDIRSYLRRVLDDTYDQHFQVMKHIPRPWPSSDELERVVNKAGGLFIFALTVAKFVGDKMHNPVERLQAILEDKATVSAGSAYTDLDSLYRDAISVFPDPDVSRLVLGVVYCMAVPLSVSALHRLLQRPDVDARIIIPALNSVLLASEDGKQPIQFYHTSFRDFLIDPRRSQKFAINPNAYHRLMAQLCFETMSNSLRRDMCGIGDPATANCEVPDLAERRQAAFDEALLYACRFWSRHLAQLLGDGVVSETLWNALKRFSTTVLLCWIEALSLFGELENAVVMLREGISWLKTLREIPKEALTLLEDAQRLVARYMDCISQCALHVYFTALSFAPTNSAIYKTFRHQLLRTFVLHPDRSQDWLALWKEIHLHTTIHSVAFSPSGDLIATAGAKHDIQLWNFATGENIASLGDRMSTSLLIRFSPTGAYLAAAFEGGIVAIWDPKIGREHLKHEGCHSEQITCLEFSPNSALLASGARDHAIQVWSVETAQALHRLATHEGPVTSLVFSSDSQRLFSGSEDSLVIIWDMSMGKVIRGMMGHRKAVNCITASEDGQLLASGSEDKTVMIWDTSSGKCMQTFSKGYHSGIRSIHFFSEDKHLVAASDEAFISWSISLRNKANTIWSAEEFTKTRLKRDHSWQAKALGWGTPKSMMRLFLNSATEGTSCHIATSYASRSPSFVFAHRGFLHAGSLPKPMNGTPLTASGTVTVVAISSDGNWAATADPLGALQIIDLGVPGRTWDELEAILKADPLCTGSKVIPSPTGARFIIDAYPHQYLVDGDYRIVKRFDPSARETLRDDDKHIRFQFCADGSTFFCVASGRFNSDKSTVRAFDAGTGVQRMQFSGLKKVHGCVASADGAWIACGHGQGQVDVLSVRSGIQTGMRVPEDENVGADAEGGADDKASLVSILVFSDDRDVQALVGGSRTGIVYVWDRASGACMATFQGSTSPVTALAYSCAFGNTYRVADASSNTDTVAPGGVIAIGRADGSLSVWSPPSTPASYDLVCADSVPTPNIDVVRFAQDTSGSGLRLISRSEDGAVCTWAVPIPTSNRNEDDRNDGDGDNGDSENDGNNRHKGEEDNGNDRNDRSVGDNGNALTQTQTQTQPHTSFLTRSDPAEALDSHFHTTYRVRKDGWLVKGERRVVWMPPSIRPRGKDALFAYPSGLILFFPSYGGFVFLRLGG